jgi:formylglycine-generating enzyme required for sulfatase activity
MSDIFISYAKEDRSRARTIAQALETEGWSVWWDRNIPFGKIFPQVIQEEIGNARCVVVLWSGNSVTKEWVIEEASEGKKRQILVPVLVERVDLPWGFQLRQAADLADWRGEPAHPTFRKLCQNISSLLGPVAKPPTEKAPPDKPRHDSPISPAGVQPAAIMTPRTNPKDGLSYVWIPPGKFIMGCSPGDIEGFDNETPYAARIAAGFWLGRMQVTQAAWKKVMNNNPSHFKGDHLPVDSVTWTDADNYCKAIGGRLPTEQEWEYAARAGTTGPRYGPLDKVAWHGGNSNKITRQGGLKKANALGLCDMLGNLWEWTASNYDDTGQRKVVRGGSWYDVPQKVRVSSRHRYEPTYRGNVIGFRCMAEFL